MKSRSCIFATLPEQFANIVDILKNRPIEEQTLNSISTILIEHETAQALRNTTTGSNLNQAGTSSNALSANVNGSKLSQTWHDRLLGAGAGTALTLVVLWLGLVSATAAAIILRA